MPQSSTSILRAFSFAMIVSKAARVTLGSSAAQHVVGAEFEDHRVGAVSDRPVEPRQSARGGVAGDAGILDRDRDAFGLERLFELLRKRVRLGEPIAGGERIAECDNFDRTVRGLGHTRPEYKHGAGDQCNSCNNQAMDRDGSLPI